MKISKEMGTNVTQDSVLPRGHSSGIPTGDGKALDFASYQKVRFFTYYFTNDY